MSTTYRLIKASPEAIFEVLGDGWLFPSWVVGASRIRDVDEAWPAEGTKIHHSFGIWPLVIDDTTSMLEWDAPRHAVFQARGWPMGEARVTIDVKPRKQGSLVRMGEAAVKGPGRLVPSVLLDPPLHLRNVEALRRLGWLAEGRAGDADGRQDA